MTTSRKLSLQQIADLALFSSAPDEEVDKMLESFRRCYGEEVIFSEEFLLPQSLKPHQIPNPQVLGWILFNGMNADSKLSRDWILVVSKNILGNLAARSDKRQEIDLDYYDSEEKKKQAYFELDYWVTYYWRVSVMKELIYFVTRLPEFPTSTQLIL